MDYAHVAMGSAGRSRQMATGWLLMALAVAGVYVAAVRASDVLDLMQSNFDAELAKYDAALVEFFAPWCGHCKRLAPEYEEAATRLRRSGDASIVLAKVDATEETALASKYGITGYPTLKVFRKGQLSGDYSGPRTASEIAKYMRKQSGPSSAEIKSMAELERLLDTQLDVIVLGLFAQEDSLYRVFMGLADKLRDSFKFAHTSAKGVLDHYLYRSNIVLLVPKVLQSKFDPDRHLYRGSEDAASIEDFIYDKSVPLVGHMTPDTRPRFERKQSRLGVPLVVAYFDADYVKNPKGTNYYRNRIAKVAKDFDKVLFAIANREEFKDDQDRFDAVGVPFFVAAEHRGHKYVWKGDFSPEALESWVRQLLANSLEPTIKSQPVPETQSDDVTVVVGKTFDSVVLNNDNDVLIEFYAPWCGHCKSLEPKYAELGRALKGEPKLTIAKIDATANDFPRDKFQVSGFPTIYFVPGADKSHPQQYNGDREVDAMLDFVKTHASHPLSHAAARKEKKGKKDKKPDAAGAHAEL